MKTLLCTLLLAVSVQAQEPIAITVNHDDAVRWLTGLSVPPTAPQRPPVTLIVPKNATPADCTAALILALGIVPHSAAIDEDAPVPAGWRHIGFLEAHKHNGHPPFRRTRLIGQELPRVEFCR